MIVHSSVVLYEHQGEEGRRRDQVMIRAQLRQAGYTGRVHWRFQNHHLDNTLVMTGWGDLDENPDPCVQCGEVPADEVLNEDGWCTECLETHVGEDEDCCSLHRGPNGCDDAFELAYR